MASIAKRGPVWRAMVRRRGESLTATFDTRADAEAWAARQEARILSGATAAQIRATPSSLTVADLLSRYAQEVCPSYKSGAQDRSVLDKLARMMPGPLAGFDRMAAVAWRDARLKQVSPASVIKEMSLLGRVWKHALLEWQTGLAVTPWSDVRKPASPPSRDRRVSDAERLSIIQELGWDGASKPEEKREWIAWAFCLAIETMMRRGEILGMTWRNVHLDRRFVHLPMTKNGNKRDVPLSSAALSLFGMIEPGAPDARVVPVTTNTFVAYFRQALAGACVDDMHFHDTRHEGITRNARKFKTVLDLSRASGHKSLQSLMRYVETTAEEMAEDLG